MTSPHVSVDDSACCGYGNCVDVAPAVFALEPGMTVVSVIEPNVRDSEVGAVETAVRDCPTQALHMTAPDTPS